MGVDAAEIGLDECIGDKGGVGRGNPDLLEDGARKRRQARSGDGHRQGPFMGYRLILAKREAVLCTVWVFFILGTAWRHCS
jgi:hypothetical protein